VPPDFVALKIRDLNPGQVTRFIHDWYTAVITNEKLSVADTPEKQARARQDAITEAQPRAHDLDAALDAHEGLARLSKNPLILSLIALVHFRRYRLPQRRAFVYRDCLDVLLDQWDRDDKGGIDVPNAPTPETRLEIVQEIAYHFQSRGIDEIETRALANLIAPILNARQARSSPEECLKEQIEKRSGLLVERAMDRYGFAHRTLQEYLTAKSFAAMPEKRAELLAHLREEPWREVILLYVGLVTPEIATQVVREILAAPGDATYSCLLLAGQCLAEDVRVDEAVRADCLARLENAFHATTDPLLFIRLATTLAGIGGQDVVDYFERVLNNSNVQVRVVAATALGTLGKRREPARIATLLLPALKDENALVRVAAINSLAQLGHTNPAISQLLHALRQSDPDPEVRAVAVRALVRFGHATELGLIKIPAGQFIMGSDESDDEKPPHQVHLEEYFIARFPVTNAQFDAFVQAGGYNQKQWWTDAGWEWKGNRTAPEKFGGVFDRANHPVVVVTWYEAIAYASWVGMRLPTEQEWEKAASWDDAKKEKRRYPWGNTFDASRCNTRESWQGARGISSRFLAWIRRSQSGGATTPVGQYSPRGDSSYGIADMAGNVWEWCGTKWIADYKDYDADSKDREDLEGNFPRVLRGGAFYYASNYVRAASRYGFSSDCGLHYVGFRVVASLL
jgi:formylglycine-generating enzyme required for sulfatase activity